MVSEESAGRSTLTAGHGGRTVPVLGGSPGRAFDLSNARGYCYRLRRTDGTDRAECVGYTNDGTTFWDSGTRMPIGVAGEALLHLAAFCMVDKGMLDIGSTMMSFFTDIRPNGLNPAFDVITVDDLLQHTSGLPADDTVGRLTDVGPDAESYAAAYLVHFLARVPVRGTYAWNFADCTLLSVVLDRVAQGYQQNGTHPYEDHVDFLSQVVLTPLGISLDDFSTTTDTSDTRTLAYGASTSASYDWQACTFFPWYGWVATPDDVMALLAGLDDPSQTILGSQQWGNLTSGRYAWRKAADGTIYFGGDNYWRLIGPPAPGVAVGAAILPASGGVRSVTVLFVNTRTTDVLQQMMAAGATLTLAA